MDILSLLGTGKTPPVTANAEEEKKPSPLDAQALKANFAELVDEQSEATAQTQAAIERVDGLAGQQISAQLFTLLSQQSDIEDGFTREEAEAWVAEILADEELEIDLSIFDREKIIQILLGIEEDPIEKVEVASDTDETLDVGSDLVAANDNEAIPPAVYQEVMTVTPVTTFVLSGGDTVAGVAIKQAMVKAQSELDAMVRAHLNNTPQPAVLDSAEVQYATSFTPVTLLNGAYVRAADGNTQLAAAGEAAKQDAFALDRNAALANVGVRAEGDTRRNAAANSAPAPANATSATETVAQSSLAVPETVEEAARTTEAVRTQQAANHTQQHSAQAWDSHAKATDRYYTMRPGAQAGNAVEQVNVSIKHGINTGIDRMVIQLEPADLGRVEIRMEVQDGRAQMVVTADKNETLDLLQRDARSLERALAEAGLEADSGSMEFQLGGGEADESEDGDGLGTGFAESEGEEENVPLTAADINYTVSLEEGLNITV